MSIDVSGRDQEVRPSSVRVDVSEDHPLLLLAAMLPWGKLVDLVVEDVKKTTTRGRWWLGRKIRVRLHLAAYFLQKLYDLTDRATEYGIKDNAAYQLFTGKGIVDGWHAPDHTRIEGFRNRLTPETQRLLANELAKVSVELGFGDPRETDFDSTVQEANISYPSDANLMTQLAGMGKKLFDYLREKTKGLLPEDVKLDMKGIKKLARKYFFLPKNAAIEVRREVFKSLHRMVKKEMYPLINVCHDIDQRRLRKMPWNIRKAHATIKAEGKRFLLDVAHFIRNHKMKAGKILSLHAKAVSCVKKGKIGKENEFGRVFQLGRIAGNFLFVLKCDSLRMEDKESLIPLLAEHSSLFGDGVLTSATADKGYWSARNQKSLTGQGVKESGLQRPSRVKNRQGLPGEDRQVELENRRAGIEPMIGHTKPAACGCPEERSDVRNSLAEEGGNKNNEATLAAGYGSVLGLNLRQLIRHRFGKIEKVA